MKKLIELDAALEGLENLNAISFYEANEHSKEAYMETRDMLKALPPIDAIRVVRCKDCKWFGDDNEDCGTCGFFEEARSANHYCSEGVRKDGDNG